MTNNLQAYIDNYDYDKCSDWVDDVLISAHEKPIALEGKSFCLDVPVENQLEELSTLVGYLTAEQLASIRINCGSPSKLYFSRVRDSLGKIPECILTHPDALGVLSQGSVDITAINSLHPENYDITISDRYLSTRRLQQYYSIYKLLVVTGVPIDGLQFWRIGRTFRENLKAIGFSYKSLLSLIIKFIRANITLPGYLDEVITTKYLNNIPGIDEAIYSLITETDEYDEHIFKMSHVAIANEFLAALSNRDLLFGAGRIVLDGDDTDDIPLGPLNSMGFYVRHYLRWFHGYSYVDTEYGRTFVHHHTLAEYFDDMLDPGHTRSWDFKKHQLKHFPKSLKIHPKVFFKDILVKCATKQAKLRHKQFGNIVFPELPTSLQRLDPTKWRHIKTAIELINEGEMMSHCVGGEGYIESAQEDDVFFHYDDGSKHGLTIELTESKIYGEPNHYASANYNDGDTWFEFDVGQIKGKHNRDPDPSVITDIHRDLLYCSDTCNLEDAAESSRNIITARIWYGKTNGVSNGLGLECYQPHRLDAFTPYTERKYLNYHLAALQGGEGWKFGHNGKKYVLPQGRTADITFWDSVNAPGIDVADLYPTVQTPMAQMMLSNRHMQLTSQQRYMEGRRAVIGAEGNVILNNPIKLRGMPSKPTTIIPSSGEEHLDYNMETLFARDEAVARVMVLATSLSGERKKIKNDPLMGRLFLSLLARRIQYGFMSVSEIEKWEQRIRNNPITLFMPSVAYLNTLSSLEDIPVAFYGHNDGAKIDNSTVGLTYMLGVKKQTVMNPNTFRRMSELYGTYPSPKSVFGKSIPIRPYCKVECLAEPKALPDGFTGVCFDDKVTRSFLGYHGTLSF